MKSVSLLYHDAVSHNNFNESGFMGDGPNLYKFDINEMERHFKAIAVSRKDTPSNIYDFLCDTNKTSIPFFLTFDDGGISATKYIAPLLEKTGWTGHFFITAGKIGEKNSLVQSK